MAYKYNLLALTAVLISLYVTETLAASSNLLPRATTESLGMADANVAIASGPSAQFINPAALEPSVELPVWEVSAFVAHTNSSFDRPTAQSAATAGKFETDSLSLVPSMAWARRLTSAIAWGFSLDVPYGSEIDWPDRSFDRALSPNNGDMAQRVKLGAVRIGPALSYRFSERVNLGARVFGQYVSALEANDISTVEGTGFSSGFQLGARLQDENFIIGSSYTSQTHTKIKGELSDIHPAFASALLAGSMHANIEFPARWQTGVALKINPLLWWETDLDWVNWSSVNDLTIVQSNGTVANAGKNLRHYRNVVSVYSGLRWQRNPTITWYAGFGYDPSPMDDRDTSPTVSQLRKTRVSLGMQSMFNNKLKFGLAYQYVTGHSRVVHSTVQDNGASSDTHLFEGTYANRTQVIGLSLSNSFK